MKTSLELREMVRDMRRIMALVPLRRRIAVVLGLLTVGLADLISLTMLLPLLALNSSSVEPTGKAARIAAVLEPVFGAVGLPQTMTAVLAVFVLIISLKSALSIALVKYTADVITSLTHDVRTELVGNVFNARWSYLVRQHVGQLSNLASNEVRAVAQMFGDVANLLAQLLQVILYLAFAFWLSWPVALLAISFGAGVFIWFTFLLRIRYMRARDEVRMVGKLASHFSDILTNIRPFRGMGQAKGALELFNRSAEAARGALGLKFVSAEISSEILEPLTSIALAVWFYVSVTYFNFVLTNLFVVGLVLIRVIMMFFSLYKLLFRVTEGRAHVLMLLNTAEETRGVAEEYPGTKTVTGVDTIAFRNVSFSYGDAPVLQDMNITFPKGSLTVITGTSGRGKSTLLDILLAFQQPQAGEVVIGGDDLFRDIDVWSWRMMIGYVPQEQVLLNDTIFENITMGNPQISRDEAAQALRLAVAADFVESLPGKENYHVGERGSALSGGQRQRISLARAFVRQPKILLLDEPTSALDWETERQIIANVQRLKQETGLTAIAISHQPAWLEVADQVYAL